MSSPLRDPSFEFATVLSEGGGRDDDVTSNATQQQQHQNIYEANYLMIDPVIQHRQQQQHQQEQRERERQNSNTPYHLAEGHQDPFVKYHNSSPSIRKFAKRAILARVERTRQEQVAQKASELLVNEQTSGGNTAAKKNSQHNTSNRQHGSSANLGTQSSFFCGRMNSYSDFSRTMNLNRSTTSLHENNNNNATSGQFEAQLSTGQYLQAQEQYEKSVVMMQQQQQQETNQQQQQSTEKQMMKPPPSADITFQALVEELRDTVPQSGLSTPDIALIMDRLLGKDVPVHFISHLQRLRHVLREVTRIARSIRRHVELHGDCMIELADVLDEDAEDEEIAREEENQKQREEAERKKKEKLELKKQRKMKQRQQLQLEDPMIPHVEENENENDNDDDDDDDEEEEESKPAWVGNVPRLRTVRPRQELLERMSQLVQKADVHAARVIDDVGKWRQHLNCPLPFFYETGSELDFAVIQTSSSADENNNNNNATTVHGSFGQDTSANQQQLPHAENVFFILHRRYGAGMPFNRACDLLRRFSAGEVFFYASPFDFSVSEDVANEDQDAGTIRDVVGPEMSQANMENEDDDDEEVIFFRDDDDDISHTNNSGGAMSMSRKKSSRLMSRSSRIMGKSITQSEEHQNHKAAEIAFGAFLSPFKDPDQQQNNPPPDVSIITKPTTPTMNDSNDENNNNKRDVDFDHEQKQTSMTMMNRSALGKKRKSMVVIRDNDEMSPLTKSLEMNQIEKQPTLSTPAATGPSNTSGRLGGRRTSITAQQQQHSSSFISRQAQQQKQIHTRTNIPAFKGGKGDMREKWKKVEQEAKVQTRYLRRVLVSTAGGWYRPSLKVICDLLWERHVYEKLHSEGKSDRNKNGGSYMRFASKGTRENHTFANVPSTTAGTPPPSSSSKTRNELYSAINKSTSSAHDPSQIYLSGNNSQATSKKKRTVSSSSAGSAPPRTTVAAATEGEENTLGLDWKHISAGCYIPIISKDLRSHLIMCYRCALIHTARHNPGVSASAGTAVQRLIALNASHLARRYLHLWQAALRRRKKLRLQAEQLALKNKERHRKMRFQTCIKFYNFRNESGRLWRPLLAKVRASIVRKYMHKLFLNRALNITGRQIRRSVYLRYYRTLHFLVVRRRITAARVTFAEEGDTRKKIRASAATSTRVALKELASAAALGSSSAGNLKMKMERFYASDGDALRVVAETGGGQFQVPSLCEVIQCGRMMMPFKRFDDAFNVERARIVAEEFLAKRMLIFEFQLMGLRVFCHGNMLPNV